MKEVYNKIYGANPNYNSPKVSNSELKYKYISEFIKLDSKILDAGCGSGYNLKNMIDSGHDAFGIEISDVCCKMFLSKLDHECIDIISFCNKNIVFDQIICSDVLEHIERSDINSVLYGLSHISDSCLYGIANHSDIQCGEQLHLIQENKEWWANLLSKFYTDCEIVCELFDNRFFFIKCSGLF